MLYAFAAVSDQVFLDLALVVGAFVDWNADLAAGARHRLALQARQLAFDVEVADFAEIEQALVEARPFFHPAAMNVVRQVIDRDQPRALGMLVDAGKRHEVDIVNGNAAAVARIAIDQIDQRIADALDCRNAELHRPRVRFHSPRSLFDERMVGMRGVLDPKRHRAELG